MLNVQSLHIYPVKSLHGISVPRLRLDPWGGENDRRWLIVDPQGQFITQRSDPVMATIRVTVTPDGLFLACDGKNDLVVPSPQGSHSPVTVWGDTVMAVDGEESTAIWLSEVIGRPCRLVYMDQPQTARRKSWDEHDFSNSFSDGFPVLVCTTASLDDLNGRLPTAIPMARFRPNLVIDGAEPWDEDHWLRLRIGTVELSLVKPCSRCVMTTVDQETGIIPDKKEPLRTLATFRKQEGGVMFGQNALVSRTGTITEGDAVEVLETR
ncbi:MOSC domain-containing protein [Acetobacter conturbans]|uniref:MOSC domain-containing protein n=1 Tax=Acetobacter conturbans TaxID=1737472 RepID=A0ABX0K0X8_9PROT|nr:MOSC domain-containing protein [Acetobacter conturbans]NHN89324.1 MOSC domain-containing protein [Acetobacter conturbans]